MMISRNFFQRLIRSHGRGSSTPLVLPPTPDLIRSLTSPDVNLRKDAWSKLHENIWHQGTIYEATSYAVPVFLELLRQPATPGKHDILAFLALLFTGRSGGDVHQHTALLQSEVRKPGFQQRLEQELAWVQATKDAVVKGRETYLGILEGDNSGGEIAAA
jgi:hypothetical protein